MGTRTTDTVNEIDEIRRDLDAKLTELGTRLPPMARWGKRTIGGLGGGVALFVLTRARTKMKQKAKTKKIDKTAAAALAPLVVRGGISTPAVLAAAAVWAGVKIYEMKSRQPVAEVRGPAVVKPMPSERRA